MRIYTQRYAMSIKTMQFWSVSTSLFLLSERLNIDRPSIVPANVKHASWINKPLAACHQDMCHSEECSPQRGAQARRGGIQYAHSSECSIKRGCRAHQQSTLLYGTQTERGCWSQYTPGYQAEPITTDRYIIPLDSPIWRVRYIYRTWKYVNTESVGSLKLTPSLKSTTVL